LDDNYFDLRGERYSHLRQFAPALLDALSLRGSARDDDLLDAIELLRRLNQTGRRRVGKMPRPTLCRPDGSPM